MQSRFLFFVLLVFTLGGCAHKEDLSSKCHKGEVMGWHWDGFHIIESGCVVIAKDAGKKCFVNSECDAKLCEVSSRAYSSSNCTENKDQTYSCPGVYGFCAKTNKVGSATSIISKGLVK
ncbi:hypothetical protein [Arenicella xantha]|nr:hypothetical protein [Arenicella xantha]